MAPVPTIGDTEGGALNAYLRRLMTARSANEQARLLYVAMTRAKRRCISRAAPKRARGRNDRAARRHAARAACGPRSAAEFVRCGRRRRPRAAPRELRARAAPTCLPTGSRRRSTRRRIARICPSRTARWSQPEFSWVGETSRHIGTVVHAALERFARRSELPTRETVSSSSGRLRASAAPPWRAGARPRAGRAHRAGSAGAHARRRARPVDFLAAHIATRAASSRSTGVAGGRLHQRDHRSHVRRCGGTRWVIDFKTSRHEGGDLEAFLDERSGALSPAARAQCRAGARAGARAREGRAVLPAAGPFREL